MNTPFLVERTCTGKLPGSNEQGSYSLDKFRDQHACVLLGAPGMGKTSAFEKECLAADGILIRASHIATYRLSDEQLGKPIFIDGLDEARAHSENVKAPLQLIYERLKEWGFPPFRLSCREADWLGNSDSEQIKQIAGTDIAVLTLDPLSDQNINDILQHHHIDPPDAFIKKAKENGIADLLRNPQTLTFLIKAVSGSEWPKSRREVYSLACGHLASEVNTEHQQARRAQATFADDLLKAAGYLSAVQLLADLDGYAFYSEDADRRYRSWKQLSKKDLVLYDALKSNVFQESNANEGLRAPIHRSVAEYLGGRYLAGLVDSQSLPVNRALALMAGGDGGIVSHLRGLAAWLATHSLTARQAIIERDPLGVVLYGDVRSFTTNEKIALFNALGREAKRYPFFRSGNWAAAPFGALATRDMLPTLQTLLASPSRSTADQALLDCALDAICHGENMAELVEPLERVVRDGSYFDDIRVISLRSLLCMTSSEKLLALAQDLNAGLIRDDDNRLIGILLHELYPQVISPAEILNYSQPQRLVSTYTRYDSFWDHEIVTLTSDAELPVLLDQMAKTHPGRQEESGRYIFQSIAGKLLVRGLTLYGETINIDRLYQWLGIGVTQRGYAWLRECGNDKDIMAWLAQHPERYKAIIEFGASLSIDRKDLSRFMSLCLGRLYDASPPEDIVEWYLGKASGETNKYLAEFYFDRALREARWSNGQAELTDSTLNLFQNWVESHPKFKELLLKIIQPEPDDWLREEELRKQERVQKEQSHRNEWISYIRNNMDVVSAANISPDNLGYLALIYQGRVNIVGDTPRARLSHFLNGETELVNAVISGLRNTLHRPDLPSLKESIDYSIKGKIKGKTLSIGHACMTGADDLFTTNPTDILTLPDETLMRLIVFRLAYDAGDEPGWFALLRKEKPTLFAEAYLSYAIPTLRKGKGYVAGLHRLANDDDYADIARLTLLKILESFPLRNRKLRLSSALDPLIKGALHYVERGRLLTLVASKLATKSIDEAQKVYWLGFGLLLAPELYTSRLFSYIGKSEVRRGYLAEVLSSYRGIPVCVSFPVKTYSGLIEALAPVCNSEKSLDGVIRTSFVANVSNVVRSYIHTLGRDTSEESDQELERLLTLPALAHWHNELRGALHDHRINRRNATYRKATLEEIDRALANQQPANAADLAALVLEQLRELAKEIRDGNTNDYEQYWRPDPKSAGVLIPHLENVCRNRFLSDLKLRLNGNGYVFEPEASHVDGTYSDIKIIFNKGKRLSLPIEIKKDHSDDLWKAMHEQLIPKYTRDPDCDGYGIYLVFWFGGGKMPTDGGKKIKTAPELEQRLREKLMPEEQARISVCVIDVSLPIAL